MVNRLLLVASLALLVSCEEKKCPECPPPCPADPQPSASARSAGGGSSTIQLDVWCESRVAATNPQSTTLGWVYTSTDSAWNGRIEHWVMDGNQALGWTPPSAPVAPVTFKVTDKKCKADYPTKTLAQFYRDRYTAGTNEITFQTHGHPSGPVILQLDKIGSPPTKVKLTGYRLHNNVAANTWGYFRCWDKSSPKVAATALTETGTKKLQTLELNLQSLLPECANPLWVEMYHRQSTNPLRYGFAHFPY